MATRSVGRPATVSHLGNGRISRFDVQTDRCNATPLRDFITSRIPADEERREKMLRVIQSLAYRIGNGWNGLRLTDRPIDRKTASDEDCERMNVLRSLLEAQGWTLEAVRAELIG